MKSETLADTMSILQFAKASEPMKQMPKLRRCLPLLALLGSLQITLGYYDPAAQRWINRDPIKESGFQAGARGLGEGEGRVAHPFAFVLNSPVGRQDALGLAVWNPLDWGYGNWCGWSRSGPGAPVDELDAACMMHDYCLATWSDAWKCPPCNAELCLALGAADCSRSPNPAACRAAKREISLACVLLGAGLSNAIGWLWGLFR
jgi:hypothetical protein